jgi:GT2 family glycosyltransferase
MPPAVQAIVVNFNAGEALLRCLETLLAQDEPIRVTVVDNASGDGSAARAAKAFGTRPEVRLVLREDNPGFAAAVNRAAIPAGRGPAGARHEPEFLLILNPDCELQPGALRALRQALESDSTAGLAGPRVTDGRGRVQRGTLRRFPDPWKSLMSVSGLSRLGRRWSLFRGVERSGELPDTVAPAEAVSGACMLLRWDAFLQLGGMDEGYGLHCEDLDLMYRLAQIGLHCLFVPQAHAVHHQGVSSRSRPLWVHWQKHRGMQRFFRKFQAGHYPWPVRWVVIAGIWLRYGATLLPVLWRSSRRKAVPA